MTSSLRAPSLLLVTALLLAPGLMFAAVDTLTVYATPNNLNDVILGDTSAAGVRLHSVYRLVSTDTTYVYDGTMTIGTSVTFLGVPKPGTGRLPCIQPIPRSDNSLAATMFNLNGPRTTAVFKNLYLLGTPTNNALMGDGIAIQVTADSIRLTIDQCVFEEWLTFAVGYNGRNDKFFITNSKFRNMVHPNQWYIGEVLRNMWPGEVPTDSVVMRNNTMFCVNGYAACPVTKYYVSYFEFVHNTVAYTFKNPFFIFNVTNAKVNDNLFYGAWAGGIAKPEYPWWDQLWSPEVGSILDLDRLDSVKIKGWRGAGWASKPSDQIDTAAEKLRVVEVKNNVCYWPTTMTQFWTSWNDTAHVDSIYTVTWMNARTTNMFTDKVTWPGLVQSGNQAVDPAFGASIPAVMTQATDGLFAWFRLVRTGTASNTYWGYQRTVVGSALNWVPTWPLPEAGHMQYTNTSLRTAATDGGPVGDPNWFVTPTSVDDPVDAVPASFALLPAFPNPFNPSTSLRYHLGEPGAVTLKVYNVLGQVSATVVNGVHQGAGTYTVPVDMTGMSSGVYFAVLEQGAHRDLQRLVLMK